MAKISTNYIINQYTNGVGNYKEYTLEVGLWDSERYVFKKYLDPSFNILDIGCGTGRTTFGLRKAGFSKIIGLDLTPEMIHEARKMDAIFGYGIEFMIGDATKLSFNDAEFDAAIFSFNGIMAIPNSVNRLMSFREINRILKNGGQFVFTTHDRSRINTHQFWEDEENKWANGWENGNCRDTLYEFGDLLATSKNESREIFIHMPAVDEVIEIIKASNFELIETFFRSDAFDEPKKVKEMSGECRFWVVKKNS